MIHFFLGPCAKHFQHVACQYSGVRCCRRSASVRAIARAKLNQRYLNSLMEMGFTKARAELALLETGNGGVEVAIEWLLQADSNKEKEAQAAKEWDVPENAPQAAPVEDTYMSPVPKRVMQLSEIAAVSFQSSMSCPAVTTSDEVPALILVLTSAVCAGGCRHMPHCSIMCTWCVHLWMQ